jgi:hypothetical protein
MIPDGHKEVFAEFGHAMNLAQALDQAIVNALIHFHLVPEIDASLARDDVPTEPMLLLFDEYTERQFSQTLGNLIRALQKATKIPPDLDFKLGHAKGRRDFLAHHFFRVRARLFASPEGRDSLIHELKKDQKLFLDMGMILMSLTKNTASDNA